MDMAWYGDVLEKNNGFRNLNHCAETNVYTATIGIKVDCVRDKHVLDGLAASAFQGFTSSMWSYQWLKGTFWILVATVHICMTFYSSRMRYIPLQKHHLWSGHNSSWCKPTAYGRIAQCLTPQQHVSKMNTLHGLLLGCAPKIFLVEIWLCWSAPM